MSLSTNMAGSFPAKGLPTSQMVINIINQTNFLELRASDVTLGVPAAAAQGADKNTDLVITAVGTANYSGSATVHYDRLDLAQLFNGLTSNQQVQVPVQAGWATTIDLLQYLNDNYDLQLSVDDIESAALTATPYPATQTLTAKSTSYGYIGTYDVQLVDPSA